MAIATTLSDRKSFILRADMNLPAEQQTTFILRPLSGAERKRCLSMLARDPGTGMYDLVRYGVCGWENLKDANGITVAAKLVKDEFGKQTLSDDSMSVIGPYWAELASAVMTFNEISEDERGNSSSSPNVPGGPAGTNESPITTAA